MGAVDTTYTFTATDTITSTKMNNIIDQTTMTSEACLNGGGLEVSAGKLAISQNAINSSRLAAGAVGADQIFNGSITPIKLGGGYPPQWSSNLSNFNIQHNSLELSTGITTNSNSFIDFHSVFPLTDYEARILRDAGVNGQLRVIQSGTGPTAFVNPNSAAFFEGPNGFSFYKDASNTSNFPVPAGTAPIFGCRAWVNFDASRDASGVTNASNTNRFIRSSGNVTSVLKTGTGKFTVTFTTAMPNTNYVVTSSAGLAGSPRFACADRTTATTTSIEIETDDSGGTAANFTENNVMVVA